MQLEDLRGEGVRVHTGREAHEWQPAIIINVFRDGSADLVCFLPAANGTWLRTNLPFSSKPGVQGTWYLPPKLIAMFRGLLTKPEPIAMPPGGDHKAQEEVVSIRVTHDNLFVSDEPGAKPADNRVQTKPAPDEPVRKPPIKPPKL